ncbi:MAG: hypothetical protein BMS9Abin12_1397 [Acidimicrobiia bacterium]|nr:MAG: hypothetical protein BMS9Abin12_1397 [Acidimicrobiia bacterium]
MAVAFDKLVTPASEDYRTVADHSKLAVGIGLVGIVLAMIVVGISLTAANDVGTGGEDAAQLLAVGFGLQTLALVTLKFGIAVSLIGILVRLWLRVESVKVSLAALRPTESGTGPDVGDIDTDYGPATVTETSPALLPIHKMARTMWFPMVVMGPMLVTAGFVTSIVWSTNIGTRTGLGAAGWTQGLQFLGEGLVLAGISFLLGSILASLREGGGEVQQAMGIRVTTLKMPSTAKAFVALMVSGLMISIAQFGLYLYTLTFDTLAEITPWWAWLGPFRELGLALLLAGVVLALATIANVLGFQYSRIRSIVVTGE